MSTLGTVEVPLRVALRLCRREDLPLLEWYGQFTHHRAIIREAFEGQARGEHLLLLAIAGDFPVGQVWIDLRVPGVATLWAVRVFPCLRGAGLGARLVRAAEDLLRARGIRRVELGVERSNPRARRFYERLGYRRIGERRESYAYTTPAGERHHIRLDEWILGRGLDGGVASPTRSSSAARCRSKCSPSHSSAGRPSDDHE